VRASAARAARWADVAADQDGLLSRRQLADLGVSGKVVEGHIAGGRWQALSRHVIALQTGRLDARQRLWLAVLEGGASCALTGLTALAEAGLTGFETQRVAVAVPLGGSAQRTEDFVRRRSRRATPENIHPARTPPQLRVGPALLDALQHIGSPARGSALLAAVVQQRLLPATVLRSILGEAATLPHRSTYLLVSGDIEGGAHSLLEIDFRRLARRAGLPPPRGQQVRRDSAGRRRYLDADFEHFAVEVDGAVHLRPRTWWDDMWRQNDVVLAGTPVLRFAPIGVRLEPERVIRQLQQAARRFGSVR
jgi:hypothetical protein